MMVSRHVIRNEGVNLLTRSQTRGFNIFGVKGWYEYDACGPPVGHLAQ